MNARGEELADNEVTKAALMIGGSEIYEWGQKWEDWQHFFWKNRDKKDENPSSDKGFNGFLSCIAGLEYYLKNKQGIAAEKDIQQLLTLHKVEKYFEAFKLLINKKVEFNPKYIYSDWVQKYLDEIWNILIKNDTDWFADYQDKNKSTERNRMILIWSLMYYITQINEEGRNIDTSELYRVVRFFYLRYNNFNRSVSTLKRTIDIILINGVWDTIENEMGNEAESPEDETDTRFRTTEETIKNKYLQKNISNSDLLRLEALIWQIEDHPLNLDGRDVGNFNITHLTALNDSITVEELSNVRDVFFEIFPNSTKSGASILKTLLLHYGDFWKDTSYYHKRYDFSDWKRNIRKPEFKLLISHLIGKAPELLLQELQTTYLSEHKGDIKISTIALSEGYLLRQKLAFYSLLMNPEDMWSEGEKVIICNDVETSRLFKDENKIIYNSKGSFKGYSGNTDLWSKAKENYANPLSELKSKIEQ